MGVLKAKIGGTWVPVQYGVSYATDAETIAGTLTDKAVTPASLDAALDGRVLPAASDAETIAGTLTTKAVTPASLKYERPYFDVRTYGAVGDGVADDTAAIQAAIDAANVAGGGIVVVPRGTWLLGARLQLKSNVTLQGIGSGSVLRSTNAAGAVEIVGNDATLEDVTVDLTGSPATVNAVVVDATTAPSQRVTIRRCRITAATNQACRVADTFTDFRFEDNTIDNCALGLSINVGTGTSSGCYIIGNVCRDVGGPNLQVYSGTIGRYTDVVVADNVLRDFKTPASAIPIEVTGVDGCIIRGNRIGSVATRGVSTAHCNDLVISANTVEDQTLYAFEIGNGSRVSLVGNTARLCNCLFQVNNGWIYDLEVVGNVYAGSPSTVNVANTYVMRLDRASRVRIADNIVTDWQFCTGVIRVGSGFTCEDVTIADNTFVCSDANSPIQIMFVSQATRTRIVGNIIRVLRNLAATDDFITMIQTANTNQTHSHVVDNVIIFAGTVTGATNATAIGFRNTGAGVQDGLVIERNIVLGGAIGIYSNTTSPDARIVDNHTRTCATPDTVPTTSLRRTQVIYEHTAAPTTGTWRLGDKVFNTAPAGSGFIGWVCTTAGTPGTWKTFGAISA